jgi:cyclohexa-1,5-dienecarbonyl-CoA hydratase
MNAYRHIRFSTADRVAELVLCRPPLNVMNMEMMQEIISALDSLETDQVHALVIRAEGKAFSAGVAVEDHLGDKTEPMIHLFHGMFHRLADLPCPSIAVVDGAALGGGCELATFCDLVIASDRAKFGQPEINLGLFPPVSIVSFPWMVGIHRTMELLLTGETISAEQAWQWGLVNRVVPADHLQETLDQLLQSLLSKSAFALRLTRNTVHQALATAFTTAIGPVEQIYLRKMVTSADAQEGLHSFLEKRKPQWRHK